MASLAHLREFLLNHVQWHFEEVEDGVDGVQEPLKNYFRAVDPVGVIATEPALAVVSES